MWCTRETTLPKKPGNSSAAQGKPFNFPWCVWCMWCGRENKVLKRQGDLVKVSNLVRSLGRAEITGLFLRMT